MNIKTEITVAFNYGGTTIWFTKTFVLPFVPFYGLCLVINDETEEEIRFETNQYVETLIAFNIQKNMFEVSVHEHWKFPVSDETIDGIIEKFFLWDRHDNTDIAEFKKFMAKEHKERR